MNHADIDTILIALKGVCWIIIGFLVIRRTFFDWRPKSFFGVVILAWITMFCMVCGSINLLTALSRI